MECLKLRIMASRKLREASIKTYLVTVVFTVVFVNIKKLHQKRLWMGKEGYVKSLDFLKDYDAVNEDIFSTQYAVRSTQYADAHH